MELFDRLLEKIRKTGPDKPIDITQAIRQVMDRQAIPMSRERTVAPNRFQVFLTPETDAAFESWGKEALLSEFIRDAQAYAREQNYSLVGAVQIELLAAAPGARKTEVKAHSVQSASPVPTPAENVPNSKKSPANSVPTGQNWTPDFPKVSTASPDSPAAQQSEASREATLLQENQDKPLVEVVGGQTYLLVGERTVVGRGEAADISLNDTSVSHRHFEIVQNGRSYILRDLGSTNGTYVEGHKVYEATLVDRNTITAGRSKLIFRHLAGTEGRG